MSGGYLRVGHLRVHRKCNAGYQPLLLEGEQKGSTPSTLQLYLVGGQTINVATTADGALDMASELDDQLSAEKAPAVS